MFTGLIEDLGRITAISATRLEVETALDDIRIGDSVAVNGACLTVTALANGRISFDYSPETSKKTALGELRAGARVNLERALKVGSRLGGHFVSGHVEGTGKVLERKREGEFLVITFSLPGELARYVVPKGSIAVDGISLTVVGVTDRRFTVAVIPHTLKNTTLAETAVGAMINIETDLLAKYVERLAQPADKSSHGRITPKFLAENGF